MALSETLLGKLQTVQNRFFKLCFGLTKRTPSVAIQLYTGVNPIYDEYSKKLLNYFFYIQRLGPQRLIWQAASQQKMWAYGDAHCWFNRIRKIMQELNVWNNYRLHPHVVLSMGKESVKILIRARASEKMWGKLRATESTRHINYRQWAPDNSITTDNNSIYWLKLKLTGFPFPFPIRGAVGGLPPCPLCGEGQDNWRHLLLHCTVADAACGSVPGWFPIFSLLYQNTAVEELFIAEFFDDTLDAYAKYRFGSLIRARFCMRFVHLRI